MIGRLRYCAFAVDRFAFEESSPQFESVLLLPEFGLIRKDAEVDAEGPTIRADSIENLPGQMPFVV